MLFFTHVCHPSLANDNRQRHCDRTALAQWVASAAAAIYVRFVFAPGTIGSLCWLKATNAVLHGLRARTGVRPSRATRAVDLQAQPRGKRGYRPVAAYVVRRSIRQSRHPTSPYGYDERQLCSPGFDLPIGRLTRSVERWLPRIPQLRGRSVLIKPGMPRAEPRGLQAVRRASSKRIGVS